VNREARIVRQFLEFQLPESQPVAVATPTLTTGGVEHL
jgi:hypothetical protein